MHWLYIVIMNLRWRPVLLSALFVVGLWVVVLASYSIIQSRKVTVERVRAYVQAVDLNKLSADDRRKAIHKRVIKRFTISKLNLLL